jgi:hypothetical protein
MAMTAWLAKVCRTSSCLSDSGPGSIRKRASAAREQARPRAAAAVERRAPRRRADVAEARAAPPPRGEADGVPDSRTVLHEGDGRRPAPPVSFRPF